MKYRNPAPTTNIIILNQDKICLVRRKIEPYKGRIALPGGFVNYGEMVEEAAMREAKEETGLDIKLQAILGVYSASDRNPSKHTISTVFIAHTDLLELKGDEESEPFWEGAEKVEKMGLAFDHNKIFSDFLKWKKNEDNTFWSGKNKEWV